MKKIYNKDGNKITTHYLINSGHFPWTFEYKDTVIK